MDLLNDLKTLFVPFQPSIDHSQQTDVIYREQKPNETLTPYIYCYWNLKSKQQLSNPFMYRVVSDGCVDILFEQSKPKELYITGFSSRFVAYDLGTSFDYVGIRFLPVAFPTIFNVAASDLTNNFLPLAEIESSLNDLIITAINTSGSLSEISEVFDSLFNKLINPSSPPLPDARFMDAFNHILRSRGSIKLAELDVALSERQLRRLFEYYFGESPKTFAKILRFQNILRSKPTNESLKHNKIFYEEGYYDQAHFIKEFKEFYGVTPGKVFGF